MFYRINSFDNNGHNVGHIQNLCAQVFQVQTQWHMSISLSELGHSFKALFFSGRKRRKRFYFFLGDMRRLATTIVLASEDRRKPACSEFKSIFSKRSLAFRSFTSFTVSLCFRSSCVLKLHDLKAVLAWWHIKRMASSHLNKKVQIFSLVLKLSIFIFNLSLFLC